VRAHFISSFVATTADTAGSSSAGTVAVSNFFCHIHIHSLIRSASVRFAPMI
jgi:hypothetical protein